jgi:23S rRNA pseudouridine955/2504/2580 synthase
LYIRQLELEDVSKKGHCAIITAFRGRVNSAWQIGSAHGGSCVVTLHHLPAHGMPTATDLKPGRIIFRIMVQSKVNIVRYEQIDESAAGQRIDNYFLRMAKGVPKSHIYRILRGGQVRVNGRRVSQTYRLSVGDDVRIPPLRLAKPPVSRPVSVGKPLPVVFEDGFFMVLDKPAGRAVHGGSGVDFGVIEQLRAQRPELKMLELAHRLDRETSGLLIVAKKRSALTALQGMMREGRMEKRYITLVAGRWPNPVQHVREPLLKYLTDEGERRVRVSGAGKSAHSVVRLLKCWQQFSLLDVELKTGRTHQIRVHLSHLGFPIAGDDKYGDFMLNRMLGRDGLHRMFLHAAKLSFDHPIKGTPLVFEAPLPAELQSFVVQLNEREPAG